MAAAAGGFGTVVCMANTKPALDSIEKAAAVKKRSDSLGLIDLYPVISLTKNLNGKELSEIIAINNPSARINSDKKNQYIPPMLSDDGKDIADDALFLAAMKEAKRIGVPISCHCDFGGDENNAISRVIELGKKAGCHIHIAHVSTAKSVETIRRVKLESKAHAPAGFNLTCEAMPHNLCLTKADAKNLGEKTWGKVNPPLRSEEDRKALILALEDGTVDAIATDHAPHSHADKLAGAPGFSGFETAFAAVYTELVRDGVFDLKRLSSLMSARPASLLNFSDGIKKGRILPGYAADLVIFDPEDDWIVEPENFKSRGKNSAFKGLKLYGKIIITLHRGKVVYSVQHG
jgi:dihydroorotase